MHQTLGIDRVVFTQPSVYGVDNSAILKGMNTLNQKTLARARGVCAIKMDATDEFLNGLHDQGIRGVRLNLDNKGGMPLDLKDISDMNPHQVKEIEHFFQVYKDLEKKKVDVGGWGDAAEAYEILNTSIERYENSEHKKKRTFTI